MRSNGTRNLEVDSTLVNLVKMIGSPEYALLVNTSHRNEPSEQVFLYFKNNQSLSVVYKSRFFHLTLYQTETVLIKNFNGWIGINSQNSEKAVAARLPIGDFRGLLSKVWAGTEKTEEVLSETDISPQDTIKLAEVFNQAATAAMVNRLVWQDGRLTRQGQVTFFSNAANLWYSEESEDSPDAQLLQPITSFNAGDVLRKYLDSGFKEAT